MFISNLLILLAVGFWVVVLIACFIFLLLAKRKSDQALELEVLVRSQNKIIDGLEKKVEELPAKQATTMAQPVSDDAKLAQHSTQERLEKSIAELAYLEEQHKEAEQRLELLQQENAILDRQLQAMTETMQASESGILNEMLVNFTEESRQMMMQVQQLEKEKLDLQQQLADTESTEKGTTGTIVGLKRKLAQAEEEIAALKKGH